MLLENIKDFDWYNEPQNFRFMDKGLLIEAAPHTDFWQNADSRFYKDDGQFFAKEHYGDFEIRAKWRFEHIQDSAQCGVMVRSDAANWLKVGLLSPNPYRPQIGVVAASQGSSDWSVVDIPESTEELWFQISRRGRDFIVFYSLDGINYLQIRMTHLSKVGDIMSAGAYVCSPKDESFECILEEIYLKD